VAATASGGETIAPIRNDSGQLNPAISKCAVIPTSAVVKKTSPIDARLMGLIAALNHASLYSMQRHTTRWKKNNKYNTGV